MYTINERSHPRLVEAMRLIEEDNGGHLIGTVYPGEPLNLSVFWIPDEHWDTVELAEAALERLLQESGRRWLNTLTCGEHSAQERLMDKRPWLTVAWNLLSDWFCGWEDER